jgi:tetratricopeptide (TPR) repeat protein
MKGLAMPSDRSFRWTPLGLVLGVLGAPTAWAQCAGAALPGASAAQIVALTGHGQTRAPGVEPWSPASLAQQLTGGADMRTLSLSSAALLLADHTQIRMSANAQLRLCESQPARTLLELAAGRLWARTKKSPATLQLQTPAALAVVRGTDWDVEVDGAGRTTLTVLSGLVELSNAQGSVRLGPSEQGFVEPGQAPVKRLLVNPRERVQWVAAYPGDATRWAEFQKPDIALPLAAVHSELVAGHWGSAQIHLRAMSARREGGAVVDLVLADLEVFDGQLDAAQARLEGAWQRTRDPRTAARRAELLFALDRNSEARAWIDAARAAAPTSVELLLADADAHRLEGRGDAALALYQQALDRAQSDAQQAEAQWALGRALKERGDLYAARVALARAVKLAPQHPGYRAEQATADTEALRLPEARTGFDAALALAGDDYTSLAGAGLLALQQGDAQAARTELLKALVIEPRYARAQVWLAVAEYRLGEPAAALDSLSRARQADPNDPLPWQIESILHNDSGEPEAAIAAAREALVRLPYLKSLNPLVSDSQGSANLGKALGDFGLEHWARAYAQQSYYPLWAGSHFFMASRYESDYSRNSELFQGYLADPLALGASERHYPVLPVAGAEALASASLGRGLVHDDSGLVVRHSGLSLSGVPTAWQVQAQALHLHPREDGSGSYTLTSPLMGLGVGVRPTDRLSLLLLHNQDRSRVAYPPGALDLGATSELDGALRQRWRRTEAGGAWRWSADEQTWFKWHSSAAGQGMQILNPVIGPQDSRIADTDRSVQWRHTLQRGQQRFSLGWERSRTGAGSSIGDAISVYGVSTQARLDMPWLAYQNSRGPWTWHAQASWPRLKVDWLSRSFDPASGRDDFEPVRDGGVVGRRALPRLGLAYRWGPGRALHAAYIESTRGIGANTLAPVAVGAIPIDFHYQLPGAFARKSALQMDWELDARSFLMLALSRQDIANPTYASDGSLLVPVQTLSQFDRIQGLGPQAQTAQTTLDPYAAHPLFERGRLVQATAAYNRVLAPRWSGTAGYTWAQSRNTGVLHPGNALPGFARHTLVLTSVWKHGGRDFSSVSMVYRSQRFDDEANRRVQAPGWTLTLMHSMDSADRRWSLLAWAQTPLDGRVKPSFWARVRYRY